MNRTFRIVLWILTMALMSTAKGADESSPLRECNSHTIKVSDSLILNIPANYSHNAWLTCGSSPDIIKEKQNTKSKSTGWEGLDLFDFFLPDFGGYTIERWRDWDNTAIVEVVSVVPAKDWGFHPSNAVEFEANQFKNKPSSLIDLDKYRDMYGLRCYEQHILKNRMFCYREHGGKNHDGIRIYVDVPYGNLTPPNPQMQAEYFSSRYGGIEVLWRTNVKNLSRWQEIDDHIWDLLTTWNTASTKNPMP